jgi:hypothetical protein
MVTHTFCLRLYFFVSRRRVALIIPSTPKPVSASVPGSGTGVAQTMSSPDDPSTRSAVAFNSAWPKKNVWLPLCDVSVTFMAPSANLLRTLKLGVGEPQTRPV